jgi:hypothetical protein
MAKWMTLMLEGGKDKDGKRLLSDATYRELFAPQTIAPFDMYPTTRLTKPHWMTYGLGWFQQDYRGEAVDFHTGSIDGMVAIHGLVRDQRLGVYVLANLDHAEVRHAIMYTVFDRYTGPPARGPRDEARGSDRDWSTEFLKLYADLRQEAAAERARKDARRVAGTSPSVSLEKLAGEYTDPLHGDVAVTHDASGLHLRYGAAFVGRLEHWHYNTFRATWNAAWRDPVLVSFDLDEDGRVNALEMMNARFTRR